MGVPLVVFLGFPYYCPAPDPRVVEEQKRVVQARAPPGKTINVRLEAEREACRADLRAGRFRQDDAVAERLSVVARHYGAVQIKLLDTVAPLIRSGHANFSPPLIFTEDGIHGSWKPNRKHPQARSPYYEAISRMLDAFVREAYAAVERGPGWGRVGSSAVPSQLHAEAGRRFPDTCYEWHHPNMPPPPVVATPAAPPDQDRPPPFSDMPPGWEEKQGPDGRTYYQNNNERRTTWTKPPPAAPIPTVTATAPPPATFPVICPHGAGPGSHLRVRAPNTGQEMTVIVPAGVGPGGQFVVPLPAAPPPRGPFYPYMAPGHGG